MQENTERVTCDCSTIWKRDYVKYYSLITVIITVFSSISSFIFTS